MSGYPGYPNDPDGPIPTGEVRTTSSTGGEKGVKEERYDLIPIEALAKVAQLYGRGAEKYTAHNWRRGYEWSKSYAALQRHATAFWSGEDFDSEMELPHMAAVIFHALALITFMEEQRSFDDRFIPEKRELDSLDRVREEAMQLRNRLKNPPVINIYKPHA